MTHTSKECVTQEDLYQDRMLKEQHEDGDLQCMTRVVSTILTQTRDRGDVPSASHLYIPDGHGSQDARAIVGSIDMTRARSGKVHVDIKGRWLGASCAEITDRE